jgi:hypothetical protein
LRESIACDDVAVIGAGDHRALITDALVTAAGAIVVLDARDVAQGSPLPRPPALLQYEIDTHLVDLTRNAGWDASDARLHSRVRRPFDMLERPLSRPRCDSRVTSGAPAFTWRKDRRARSRCCAPSWRARRSIGLD